MSYTIVYKKNFLRIDGNHTKDGTTKYLPLVLCGDNNVYDYTRKRSREWQTMFPSLPPLSSEKELLQETRKIPDDAECFVFNSHWIYGKDLTNFVQNGINYAKSIEELHVSSAGLQLRMYAAKFSNDGLSHKPADEIYTNDTQTIIDWLGNHSADKVYIQYSPKEFKTRTPKTENPVVLKERTGRFVSDYERNENGNVNRISLGALENAKIFTSYDEAKEITETFRDLRIVQHKNVTKNKPWRVITSEGLFVKKTSSRHLWFASDAKNARKFTSQNEAEKYIKEKLAYRFDRTFTAIRTS